MNQDFCKNHKSELDAHLNSLQAIADTASGKIADGRGDSLARMSVDLLPSLMQTISFLSGRVEYLSEERISIQTPEGTLVAFPDGDEDYPGITVELERPGLAPVRLAMIEHTDSEGICGHDPRHPEEDERERSEVPPSLLKDEHTVMPCLLCRSWPRPCKNDELHHRTFYLLDNSKEE